MGRRAPTPKHRFSRFVPAVVNAFEWLDVPISLKTADGWQVILARSHRRNLWDFELEHGVEADRNAYNERCIAEARRRRAPFVGQHAGFSDLFVPLGSDDAVDPVLVTGPFSTEPPCGVDVLERWRRLTGRQGHPSDPELADYVAATLSALVLEGPRLSAFQRLVQCLARLMADRGSPEVTLAEVGVVRDELADARLAERMWEAVHAMVREATSRSWASPHRASWLLNLGCSRMPEHVLVALMVNRRDGSDSVDDIVRRDAFQRASVKRAKDTGDLLCGQVGNSGITLLSCRRGSAQRTRQYLLEVAERLASLARRRFGLGLHAGLSATPASLAEQYRSALAGAETALSKGLPLAQAPSDLPAHSPLGPLRRELGDLVETSPRLLPGRFDGYLEVVAVRGAQRLDLTRAHADAGFERIAEALRESGTLDERALGALLAAVERATSEAATLDELCAAYRRAVSEVVEIVTSPRTAPRDRSLRRAEEHIKAHFVETLTLAQVARASGFTPKYLSKVFHEKQGMTFERYVTELRLERARQLLAGTSLKLQRVAQLSGFSTANYLVRVFKRFTGATPAFFRQRVRGGLGGYELDALVGQDASRK
jgi:AraC-like DNA-binding protein